MTLSVLMDLLKKCFIMEQKEAYNAGSESIKNTLLKEVKLLRKDYAELLAENEQLEKNSLVWHKTDFEEPEDLALRQRQMFF